MLWNGKPPKEKGGEENWSLSICLVNIFFVVMLHYK